MNTIIISMNMTVPSIEMIVSSMDVMCGKVRASQPHSEQRKESSACAKESSFVPDASESMTLTLDSNTVSRHRMQECCL